ISPLQVIGEGSGPRIGAIVLPHASTTTGGVGRTASAGQFTVEAPLTGKVKSGISIVYVYVQSCVLLEQSVYVNVYTISPLQISGVGAGPATGVITFPQASVTLGGVGATASAGQFTVEAPLTGKVKSGISIV